jgi:hypothetical protein
MMVMIFYLIVTWVRTIETLQETFTTRLYATATLLYAIVRIPYSAVTWVRAITTGLFATANYLFCEAGKSNALVFPTRAYFTKIYFQLSRSLKLVALMKLKPWITLN